MPSFPGELKLKVCAFVIPQRHEVQSLPWLRCRLCNERCCCGFECVQFRRAEVPRALDAAQGLRPIRDCRCSGTRMCCLSCCMPCCTNRERERTVLPVITISSTFYGTTRLRDRTRGAVQVKSFAVDRMGACVVVTIEASRTWRCSPVGTWLKASSLAVRTFLWSFMWTGVREERFD